MALEEIRVPDIGTDEKVDVVEVLVSTGDQVAADDGLITLESDKATMDVPAPFAGAVREVKVKAGDRVGEGDLILMLEAAAAEAVPEPVPSPVEADAAPPSEGAEPPPSPENPPPAPAPSPESAPVPAPASPTAAAPAVQTAQVIEVDFTKAYASPAVRRFARLLGVDLNRVAGTGRKNRILKEDVEAYVRKTLAAPEARGGRGLPELPVIDFTRFGEVERVPLTRVQQISGPNLQRSWLHAPHVTQHDEADVTDLEAFRQEHKARAKAEGFNLTPLAFVMKAVVAALAEFPRLNASLDPDGEHVIHKKYFHLGVAVDTPEGLMVPVVRNVDQKGVFELARELAEVSQRTRKRKLKPDDLRGASFTITSLGGIGGTFFTPIINVPEVAILGVSRSTWKPVWTDGEFVPRLVLPLSLSYDHRVVDGAMAVRFTTHLSALLSDIRTLVL